MSFHKSLMLSVCGLGSLMTAAVARMSDNELGIIELEANLADVEKPLELPPGVYVGEIQDVSMKASQAGNQYFNVKFVVAPDQVPAELVEQFEDGAVLYWNRTIVPNGKDRRALFNLRKFLEAIGIESNTTSIDPNEWMGCQARLRVVNEPYQGENRASIKSIESAEAPAKPAKEVAKGRARK